MNPLKNDNQKVPLLTTSMNSRQALATRDGGPLCKTPKRRVAMTMPIRKARSPRTRVAPRLSKVLYFHRARRVWLHPARTDSPAWRAAGSVGTRRKSPESAVMQMPVFRARENHSTIQLGNKPKAWTTEQFEELTDLLAEALLQDFKCIGGLRFGPPGE